MNGGSSSPDGPHPPPVKVTIPVKVNPLSVFGKIFPYAFSVYFVFTVTLACFPATTLMVRKLSTKTSSVSTRGVAKGATAPPNFQNCTNTSVFSTNALSRFASVVLDGVLGPPRTAHRTLSGVLVSL